jgi:hypothetical protein
LEKKDKTNKKIQLVMLLQFIYNINIYIITNFHPFFSLILIFQLNNSVLEKTEYGKIRIKNYKGFNMFQNLLALSHLTVAIQ